MIIKDVKSLMSNSIFSHLQYIQTFLIRSKTFRKSGRVGGDYSELGGWVCRRRMRISSYSYIAVVLVKLNAKPKRPLPRLKNREYQ